MHPSSPPLFWWPQFPQTGRKKKSANHVFAVSPPFTAKILSVFSATASLLTNMIEDFAIPHDVWEAALKVSNYAKQQGWGNDWCIADICSRNGYKKLEAEAAEWKANHDNQVKLKSVLINRPDLRDRAERMQKFIDENSQYKKEYEKLRSICNRIYVARNIGLNPDIIIECLEEIDALFREENMN